LPNFSLPSKALIGIAMLVATVLHGGVAAAQILAPEPSGPPPQNPICQRLVSQLNMIDRGGDPGRADQIRRYEEAQAKQQGELERLTAQAKRMGCDSSGFFSLFNGQSAQCGPINNQIQQMRGNLDQIVGGLQQLRGNNPERDMQRRSVLVSLAQNNCGPQYAAAARAAQQQDGFFGNLFGNNEPGSVAPPPPEAGGASGTYRTVCVRSCDGYYFPISFATVPARFGDDERTCKAQCPAADASLFTYRNPGEDMNQAVSLNGQPYSSSPNAFLYRKEFNPSCSCKAAGQTWADALKNIDDKAAAEQQGDIIVTEDRARKMSQPVAGAKASNSQKKGAAAQQATPPAAATTPAPPAGDTTGQSSSGNNSGNTIRSVGPTFLQH
jgi:hypothetical protein